MENEEKALSINGVLRRHELTELAEIIVEAAQTVEDELSLEDQGWIRGDLERNVISSLERTNSVKLSRLYYTKDPLGKQAVRLWTDYTLGTGMTWSCEDEKAKEVLEGYWNARINQAVLSSRGQRKSAVKLLVDGEIFFCMFLGDRNSVKIRRIDPLEISEIITDPDDKENERYYKREWFDTGGQPHTDFYPSHLNEKDEPVKDSGGREVKATEPAQNTVVYHLPWDDLGQRGMPLLLPALDWIKQYRRFLASRVAIMLALAKFAWRTKTNKGTAAIAAAKAKFDGEEIPAGSMLLENLGFDTTPIRTDSNARNAYDDGRMLKLQVAAAVGIPEQYFGDISIGNLATAKTVELPMMKMFQSFQQIWRDAYQDMDEIVLEHGGAPIDAAIDRDMPAIAPADVFQAANAIATIITAMPEFAMIRDVQQVALLSLGINDVGNVLDELEKNTESAAAVRLIRALRNYKEEIERRGNGKAEYSL